MKCDNQLAKYTLIAKKKKVKSIILKEESLVAVFGAWVHLGPLFNSVFLWYITQLHSALVSFIIYWWWGGAIIAPNLD